MKIFAKISLTAAALAGTAVMLTAPADARVSVGIGIGIPGSVFGPPPPPAYGPAYYPPGPCYNYHYAYNGWCGYPAQGDPIFIDGAWVTGPHYFRNQHGRSEVWFNGHWRGDFHRR